MLSREGERAAVDVDPGHDRPRTLDEIVRELALAAADVEHALPRPDALDEELVVAGQPVLRVDAAVEIDREEVDPAVQVAVELQQTPERDSGGLPRDRRDPEPEERPDRRSAARLCRTGSSRRRARLVT